MRLLVLLLSFSAFQLFSVSAFAAETLLETPDAPHPVVRVVSVDAAAGVVVYQWLKTDGTPADSGNSLARFTPVEPVADPETGVMTYPEPSAATLIAAITAPDEPQATAQPLETVLNRLTDTELAALLDSTDIRVRRFLKLAEIRGTIRPDSPELASGAALLDALGIITAARWAEILAP